MKISEKKAFEEYPKSYIDENTGYREGYIKGYDQATKDFIKKAEEFFYEQFYVHPHDCHVVQYESDKPLEDIDDFVEDFKKAIEGQIVANETNEEKATKAAEAYMSDSGLSRDDIYASALDWLNGKRITKVVEEE